MGATIMNRVSMSQMAMLPDPIQSVFGDRAKREAATRILGQAYALAYTTMVTNRAAIEQIAQTLIDRKELYGDEVIELLDSVDLARPAINLHDHTSWPAVA
jgi:ATP-dependent Zn protease